MNADDQKRIAAEHAADYVGNGMIVGLGSGSTAELAVHALGKRYRAGLRFMGVPTSDQTGTIAASYGIELRQLDDVASLDVTIDGADEVDPYLQLIKGHGGALVREKLVASHGKRFIVIVDESKLVSRLGEHMPVPVEVVTFGWTTTRQRLETLGLRCERRGGESPYLTLNHNYILDCDLPVDDPGTVAELAVAIKEQTGVVDHGFFLDMASTVIVGQASGEIEVHTRQSH